ncbi:MAG: hypothetical protein ACFIN1_00555 [Candidatus Walczuchella monophlebidarum]
MYGVNCHRTTEVNMDNKLHEKLKKQHNGKNPVKVTVDSVGGIECGKCH